MIHSLPPHIVTLLETWEYLGFSCLRGAVDFILANSDWNLLVKDTDMKPADVRAVDEWRTQTIEAEKKWQQ